MTATPRAVTLGLVVLGVVVWGRAVGTPFVFDDRVAIVENPNLRSVVAAVGAPPRSVLSGRPLPSLTLGLNHALGGLDPRGYHAVNVLLHVAAALVLAALVRTTLRSPRLAAAFGPDADGLAAAVAAIWLVHPLHTEPVTYVTQRTELLMGLCWLATLLCAARDRPVAAVACCALGMASKEPMAGVPLLVALWDRTFRWPTWRAALAARGRLWAALAATWLVLGALLLVPRHASIAGDAIAPVDWIRTQAGVVVRYLGLVAWPIGLSIDHGVWVVRRWLDVLPQAVGVAALVAGTVVAVARARPVGFAGAWVVLGLAPTTLVPITTEVMAERRMYVPLAAVVAVVVVAASRVLRRPAVRVGVLAVVVGVLATLTVRRIGDFASEVTLWQAAVRTDPDNVRAHANLGALLLADDRVDEAAAAFERARTLAPERADLRYDLGTVAIARGRLDEAAAWFADALAADPDLVDARYNLATVRLEQGRWAEAIAGYEEVLRRAPDHAYAADNLRVARARLAAAGGR